MQVGVLTLAATSYLVPLASVSPRPLTLVTSLYCLTLVTMAVCTMSSLGFPFSQLTPHRALVLHTQRVFHDRAGGVEKEDSGYYYVNLDRHSPAVLAGWVPQLREARQREITAKQCEQQLYCGMPVYYPASSLLRVNHWLPAPPPRIWTPVTLNLTHTAAPTVATRKLLFRVTGPDHLGVFLSPATGIRLASWSLAAGELLPGPDWKPGRPTFYIFHSSGKQQDTMEFWLELEVPRSHYEGNELVDMAVTGHFLHGSQQQSGELKQFLQQFPGWSYPVGWSSVYKAYKF